jgi:hypothetical protein
VRRESARHPAWRQVVEKIALDGPGLHERRYDTCGDYTAHVIHAMARRAGMRVRRL